MQVKPGGVDFYEAGARLEGVIQVGQERTIKTKLAFEGEGDFWDRIEVWNLSADGSKLTITTRDDPTPSPFVKCEP